MKAREQPNYQPIKCAVCNKCKIDTNPRTNPSGRCIYAGPYEGYIKVQN